MANTISTEPILARQEESDKQLHRKLTFWDLLFLSMGGIIGSGWLLSGLDAAHFAGPGVFISWIIGGILVLFIALNYAEVSGMLPRSGAIVRYPHLTHGSYTGYMLAWAYFLTAVTVPATEAIAVLTYASAYIPGLAVAASGTTVLTGLGIILAIVLTIIFFLLNYFGIRLLGTLNSIITVWKLIIPVLTFIFLFFLFNGSNFSLYGGLTPLGTSPIFQAIPLTGIVFAYLGFRQALDYGGEGRNPQRDVPLATIISVLIAMVIYTLLQIAFTGAINWKVAGVTPGSWAALAASGLGGAPLAKTLAASGVAFFAAFAVLLYADAYISPSGTGLVYIGTGTRTIYGSAVDGYLPSAFHKANRWGVPIAPLVAATVIGWLFLVPLPSWYELVNLISSGTVLTYIMGGIGLRVLRRTAGELRRPFRLGGSAILSPIGFIAATLIVFWSGTSTLNYVVTGVFIGLPIYAWYYAHKRMGANAAGSIIVGVLMAAAVLITAILGPVGHKIIPWWLYFVLLLAETVIFSVYMWLAVEKSQRHQILASAWFIVLVFGIYLLSYFSVFGPSGKAAQLAFPWGTVIDIVFSIVMFFWAVASGYKTPEIEDIIATQSATSQAATTPETPDKGAPDIGATPAS
jgi:amino acid transporter